MKVRGTKNGMDIYLKVENDKKLVNLKNLKDIKIWKNTGLNTILVFKDNTEMFIDNNFQETSNFIRSKQAI